MGVCIVEEHRRQELTARIVNVAEHLNRQVFSEVLAEWADLDMTIPQIQTLVLLQRMGPLRMGSISASLGKALSGTTIVVDRLVERDLVKRISGPPDRRVVLCALTDQGEEMVARLWHVGRQRTHTVVDLMTEDQLEFVAQGLELIRQLELSDTPNK